MTTYDEYLNNVLGFGKNRKGSTDSKYTRRNTRSGRTGKFKGSYIHKGNIIDEPGIRRRRVEECGKGFVPDPTTNKCISINTPRGHAISNIVNDVIELLGSIDARSKWKKKPGDPGFNAYALQQMKKEKLGKNLQLNCNGNWFAYQDTASYCLHPKTTIDRLLVIHRTGTGKTRTMVKILNSYFSDPRPKIAIFPTQETTNNFYKTIMSFPNRYSEFVIRQFPNVMKSLDSNSASAVRKIQDILAMKGKLSNFKKNPLDQTAPLRAYRYSVAGGSSIFGRDKPNDPIFKFNFKGKGHEYSNKIIVMDEVHNMIIPSPELAKYKSKLMNLRSALYKAENSIIGGFTATPVVGNMESGKELLKVIKGAANQNRNNEGFISYFYDTPSSVYPKITLKDIMVKIPGQAEYDKIKKHSKPKNNYEAYIRAYKYAPHRDDLSKNNQKVIFSLCNYINMGIYYTQVSRRRSELIKDLPLWATKMHKIIQHIEQHKKKSLILIHRRAGFRGLVEAFKSVSKAGMYPNCKIKFCFSSAYDSKKDQNLITEFSKPDNLKGSKIMIFIADSSQFGEGVSFFGVRHLYLFNPPFYYSEYLQLAGRVLRACASHGNLPANERNVFIYTVMGTFSDSKIRSVDVDLNKNLKSQQGQFFKDMGWFHNLAVDKKILDRFVSKKATST
jgi:superfamily II DNA or RNA helicase